MVRSRLGVRAGLLVAALSAAALTVAGLAVPPATAAGANGTISGVVKDSDTRTAISACVLAFDTDPGDDPANADVYWADCTDSSGAYTIPGIPAGTYKLYLTSPDQAHSEKWYSSARSFTTATAVSVLSGQTTTINGLMTASPVTISGTITNGEGKPVSGAVVQAHPATDPGTRRTHRRRRARTGPTA